MDDIITVFIILGIVVLIPLYFLPTIIAMKRRCYKVVTITLIDVFLGITAVGWLASLIWAIVGKTQEDVQRQYQEDMLRYNILEQYRMCNQQGMPINGNVQGMVMNPSMTGVSMNGNVQGMAMNTNISGMSNDNAGFANDILKDPIGKLNELKQMLEAGFISEEEYEEKRKQIIDRL